MRYDLTQQNQPSLVGAMASSLHKVFVSHCQPDRLYQRKLAELAADGSADLLLPPPTEHLPVPVMGCDIEQIQQVRLQRIGNARVTMVLIGRDAWRSEQIHQDICASLIEFDRYSRVGLLGIVLPTYRPALSSNERRDATPPRTAYCPYNIPPLLWENVKRRADGDVAYAMMRPWPRMSGELVHWIEHACSRAAQHPPPVLVAGRHVTDFDHGKDCWSE